jgi:hypothetical protein
VDISAQGGYIHIFKPLDIFFQKKAEAVASIEAAYEKLTAEQKKDLLTAMKP